MKRFMPDTIAGRTIIVLLLGLTVSHLVSVAMYIYDRGDTLSAAGEAHVGERIVTLVQLIERAPEADWHRIVSFANTNDLRVAWDDDGGPAKRLGENWRSLVLSESLAAHFKKLKDRAIFVRYGTLPLNGNGFEPESSHNRVVHASVEMINGRWLSFSVPVEQAEPFWSFRFVLSMIVMIVAIFALAALVVRHLVRPLSTFSRAAERLGTDINSPPLEERGPLEVRHATQAFNEMQSRIQKLLEGRTRMLAAITHDLRTPITRLRLRTDFIDDDTQRDKSLQDLDEVEAMISSLLSFAREDALNEPREAVDLMALLQTVCDDFTDAGHEVAFNGDVRLPVLCSPHAIRRAFDNLLENAVRYGGCARLSVTQVGGQCMITIDDDGPGIPEDEMEKVFEPFYRVEQSRNRETGGTGIGLYVARSVIRGHGGDIALANRDAGGLCVTVTLPN